MLAPTCSYDPAAARTSPLARPVALAGGGTAGHVFPGVAIAEALGELGCPRVRFFGAPGGFELRAAGVRGLDVRLVRGGPFFGVGAAGKLASFARVLVGALEARRILAASGVRLVIGIGGYASAAALLGARMLRLRTAVLEANTVAGLTNALVAPRVDRVFLGFRETERLAAEQARWTGVPVRRSIVTAGASERRPPRSGRSLRVLVTGGSLGSPFLNRHAPELCSLLADARHALEVLHQAGDADLEAIRRAYADAGVTARVARFVDDPAGAYAGADVAIARAGAGTIAELAVSGLPSLLVPLPRAPRDHQARNAAAYAAPGACLVVPEREWRPRDVADRILALAEDESAWSAASAAARAFARPDAAATIAAEAAELVAAERDRLPAPPISV